MSVIIDLLLEKYDSLYVPSYPNALLINNFNRWLYNLTYLVIKPMKELNNTMNIITNYIKPITYFIELIEDIDSLKMYITDDMHIEKIVKLLYYFQVYFYKIVF